MSQSIKHLELTADENSTLPVSAGLVAGLLGTGVLLILVFGLMAILQADIRTAAHDTLSALLGADYRPNVFQIIAGTTVHLLLSGLFGATFAAMPCCFPRGFWLVAGLIFGMGTGAVACILARPLMMIFGVSGSANYFLIMWFNVLYGFFYGLAAATYGVEWNFVTNLRRYVRFES